MPFSALKLAKQIENQLSYLQQFMRQDMKNLSITDKLIRVSLALILIYLAHLYNAELGYYYWAFVFAVFYLLTTSFLSFCYIYYPLNLRTNRAKPRLDKRIATPNSQKS